MRPPFVFNQARVEESDGALRLSQAAWRQTKHTYRHSRAQGASALIVLLWYWLFFSSSAVFLITAKLLSLHLSFGNPHGVPFSQSKRVGESKNCSE